MEQAKVKIEVRARERFEREQAVLECLDDLQEVLWQHYLIPVHELQAEERRTDFSSELPPRNEDEEPF